jgi:predicted permease
MGLANQSGGFFRKLALLFRRNRFRSELDEEMAFHRAQAEKEYVLSGMGPKAARKAAMRQFGNPVKLKEQSHEAIGFRLESVARDLRFALRQLHRNPGFAATAIVILALGIGASVAIFGFVDAALIKPLPYANPNRLTMLFEGINLGPRFHLSYLDYLDWKKRNRTFQSLDIFASTQGFMLKTPQGLQAADGVKVSAGFFRTLGVTPALGRDFYPEEDAQAAPQTALLSYGAWQKRYGGRQDVLGQSVVLDGATVTIVGVLPRGFYFAPAEPSDFWVLQKAHGAQNGGFDCAANRNCHDYFGVARLKDGISFETAYADIKSVEQQMEVEYPDSNRDRAAFMLPLTEVIVGDIRPILLVLLGGSALLLLIAGVNVASLLLVRSESRKREIAVRGALGASTGRLIRQFVTEGLLLAVTGGAIGVAAGVGAMHLLTQLVPEHTLATMPYLQGLGLNLRVAGFAAALCIATGGLFALTPIVRISTADMREGLTEGGRGASGTWWRRFGGNLVVIEIATAMVLLVGAGLLGKSLFRLMNADAGLAPDHLALLRVAAVGNTYRKDAEQIALEQSIAAQIGSLPGVQSIAVTSHLPLGDGDGATSFHRLDRPYLGVNQEIARRAVSPSYFPALRARILRGRNFREDEDESKPSVAVINVTMANQYFPGEDPIGKRIAWDNPNASPIEIVGIVNDLQEGQLDSAPRAALYMPFDQGPDDEMFLVVRTSQQEDSVLQSMTAAIQRIDPGLAVSEASTMRQRIQDSPTAYLHRTAAAIVGGFAAIALLLSVVGLYGVIAYSVAQRTREIGVRMALGAPRGSVYALILSEAGWLTGFGIALGLVAAVGAATLMRKLLFGTEAWDAVTLTCVSFALGGAAMLASYLPARRAASVNPVEAIRAE